MMLAWPGSEREASDDLTFFLTIRLIVQIYYGFNLSQNHHFVTGLREGKTANTKNEL